MPSARRKRILVIRLSSLGDVVMVEPVVRRLRGSFPGASIELVTQKRYLCVAERMGLDRTHAVERSDFSGLRALARSVRGQGQIDLIVDLQNKLRSLFLSRFLRAAHVVCLRKRSPLGAVRSLFGKEAPIDHQHNVGLYLSALVQGNIVESFEPLAPRLARDTARLREARAWIGLCPCASQPTKEWPLERFSELSFHIRKKIGDERVGFVLVGGPDDAGALEVLRRSIGTEYCAPVEAPGRDVEGLIEILSSLDYLVSVDTGPAHLAAALGVVVARVFGPTSAARWGPVGTEGRVISRNLDCAPCSNFGGLRCPRPDRDHECMRELSPEDVFQAIESDLSSLCEIPR